MERNHKEAKLLPDECNPRIAIKSFWMIPKDVVALKELSAGAKLMYAVLVGMSGKYGKAFPKRSTLKKALGSPSDSTLYRWQQELEEYKLIRVKQKGRGLSNDYYFLRSPLLGNMDMEEYEQARYAYRGKKGEMPRLVTPEEASQLFESELQEWYQNAIAGIEMPFPKPAWKCNQSAYRALKEDYVRRAREVHESM